MQHRLRPLPLVALALALLGACARTPEPLQAGTRLPAPKALPAVHLTDNQGRPLTRDGLVGRPTLLFFGFTSCPEFCPTSLATLSQAVRQLDDLAPSERPRILFVSVDPRRDTPVVLNEYAGRFGDAVIAATGDTAALDEITSAVGAYYRVGPQADPAASYTVEHSGQVFVLDSDARLVALFSPPLAATPIAHDLRRLAGRHGVRP